MHASRMAGWGRTFSLLALAATLALTAGCSGDDDDGGGGGGGGGADGGSNGGGGDGGTGAVTVSGRVTYDFVPAIYSSSTKTGTLDFAHASEKPARNVVVQVLQGSTPLATTNTDAQGNYLLTFTPSATGALSIIALARTTTPAIQIEDNTDRDAIWAIGDSLTATSTTKNLRATHGWTGTNYDANRRTAAAFAVLDSMYTAARAFMAVRQVSFPLLKVNWSPNNVPQSGDKKLGLISTSHFSPSENEIYVLGKAGVDTDEFDTHVIVHEWGHYFEANLSRSDSPGGPHGKGDVLDPRLAFGEGYGNAIAAMALPESMYVDTAWSSSQGPPGAFGFDAETAPSPTDDPTPGPFSEMSVLRVLYDLYDPGTNESAYDQVSINLGTIYDVLVGPQKITEAMTTIGSFIAALKGQSGVNATAVNNLLAHYEIGPITSPFGDEDSKLRAMYTNVASYPFDGSVPLGGGFEYNTWQQNQYYVFTGNGARVTISATSSSDVAIVAYRRGQQVGGADSTLSGTETFSITTQPDTKYVLVLTGFETAPGDYNVSVSLRSP